MARGRRVAIDVGTVRVGIAMSDLSGLVASPLATVSPEDLEDFLKNLANEEEVSVIYVGLPLHLSGSEGASSAMARATALELRESLEIPIRLLDERLTTVIAHDRVNKQGGKIDRSTIDQGAALALLEFALQAEAHSGTFAGADVL